MPQKKQDNKRTEIECAQKKSKKKKVNQTTNAIVQKPSRTEDRRKSKE